MTIGQITSIWTDGIAAYLSVADNNTNEAVVYIAPRTVHDIYSSMVDQIQMNTGCRPCKSIRVDQSVDVYVDCQTFGCNDTVPTLVLCAVCRACDLCRCRRTLSIYHRTMAHDFCWCAMQWFDCLAARTCAEVLFFLCRCKDAQ